MRAKMVNSRPDIIEKIYLDQDWRNIIKLRNNIRIPTPNPLNLNNYVHDQPETVWEIMDRDGIIVHENSPFLDSIKTNIRSLQDNPTDIYLLDRETKCKLITENTGVFITNNNAHSSEPLKISWSRSLSKGEEFSWDSFFRRDVMNVILPSNALIIVDRYLLNDFYCGCQNLIDILDPILPPTIAGDYHILIVTDDSTITEQTVDIAVDALQDIITSLERPYPIILELLFVNRYSKNAAKVFYGKTHDRHIYSNYFVMSADHGFCAIEEKKLVAKYGQTIRLEGIYSGIDNKYQDISSLPSKASNDFITAIENLKSSKSKDYKFYINTKAEDIRRMRNRLVQ